MSERGNVAAATAVNESLRIVGDKRTSVAAGGDAREQSMDGVSPQEKIKSVPQKTKSNPSLRKKQKVMANSVECGKQLRAMRDARGHSMDGVSPKTKSNPSL